MHGFYLESVSNQKIIFFFKRTIWGNLSTVWIFNHIFRYDNDIVVMFVKNKHTEKLRVDDMKFEICFKIVWVEYRRN